MTYNDIVQNIAHSGSTQLLVKLFGGQIGKIFPISSHYAGPDQTLLTVFASLFSVFMVWLFVALVVYFFLTGTVNQAQSGEFMSRNWNGVWPILRLAFGVTAVAPFPGTSFVLIQAFVIALALLSSSVADLTWGKLLSQAGSLGITTQQHFSPVIDTSKTEAYLREAYLYSVCAVNRITYDLPDTTLTPGGFDPVHPGSDAASQEMAQVCGGDKFQAFVSTPPSLPSVPNLTPAPGSDLVSDEGAAQFNAYQKQQYDYATALAIREYMTRTYHFVVDHITAINAHDPGVASQWADIEKSFHDHLQQQLRQIVAADAEMTKNVFVSQASLYGWISAGSYYRQLAQAQQIVSNAIASSLAQTPEYIPLSRQADLTAANTLTTFSNQTAGQGFSGWMNRMAHQMTDPLGFRFLKSDETTDPLLAMTRFGQTLEGAAEALLAMKGAGTVLSFLPGVGGVIDTALNNGIVNLLLCVTLIAGLVLGTVLPAMPWIIFMFAVLSWMIHVAEMFIAAPFWIVANGAPDGQTLFSDIAKKGANNILFIVFFPTLALGGLVASLAISWMGIGLVNQFTYTGFQATVGFGTFPLAFLGTLALYVVVCWTVLMTSLNLIQDFPRTILNWISLSAPGLSPFKDKHSGIQGVLMAGPVAQVSGSTARAIAPPVRQLKK